MCKAGPSHAGLSQPSPDAASESFRNLVYGCARGLEVESPGPFCEST